jgi:NADPH:quinone reductase-like Zn-dependent oxidoreductase
VIRLTENRGLDVIFNRLSGDGLVTSLECIAPFGRFIDIRRSDIRGLENFPIPSLAQNMTYITVDLATMLQQKPSLITNSLSHVMGFFEEGKAGKLRTSKRHGVSEIGKVFEMIQSEDKSEDFVIEVKDEEKISVLFLMSFPPKL